MVFGNLLMIDSLGQWAFVLVIALIVFGPKRMPELGKQIGTLLRDMNKVKNDMLGQIHTEIDNVTDSYSYTEPTPSYRTTYPQITSSNPHDSPEDMTDYTIVGVTPKHEDDDNHTQPRDEYHPSYPGYSPDAPAEKSSEEPVVKDKDSETVKTELDNKGESHV